MRIGLSLPIATAAQLRMVAAESEAAGFASIWLGEHVVTFDHYASAYPYGGVGQPEDDDSAVLEPLTALSFLAAASSTIRLATGILILAQRNPVVTAYQIATLDWLSDGRLDVGIGLNWAREEYVALGVPWERRGARTDEYVEVVRTLLTDEVAEYSGAFYELPACRLQPRPVQAPHPPFFVGGNSDGALRRTARLAQGWYGLATTADETAQYLRSLAGHLEVQGRSLQEIETAVFVAAEHITADTVAQFAATGLDEIVLPVTATSTEQLRREIDQLSAHLGAV